MSSGNFFRLPAVPFPLPNQDVHRDGQPRGAPASDDRAVEDQRSERYGPEEAAGAGQAKGFPGST